MPRETLRGRHEHSPYRSGRMHDDRPIAQAERAAPFLALARQVGRRWMLARWLRALERSALPVFGLLLAVGAAIGPGRREAFSGDALGALPVALVLVTLWLATSAWRVWRGRPDPLSALAWLDERLQDEETFVSACSLARERARGPGVLLHLQRAQAALGPVTRGLPRSLPVRVTPRAWAPALVFLLVAGVAAPSRATPAAADPAPLEQGSGDTRDANAPDEPPTPDDRPQPRERLAHAAGARAPAREDQAETHGGALLDALQRHPETAELATALGANSLDAAARAAALLARRLRTEDLSEEAQARIEHVFERGLEIATPSDAETELGRRLEKARQRLAARTPALAGDELEALARSYQRRLERTSAAEVRRQLAEDLRTSGSRGRGATSGGAQKMPDLGAGRSAPTDGRPPDATQGTSAGARREARSGGPGPDAGTQGQGSAEATRQGGEATSVSAAPSTGTGQGSAPVGTAASRPLPASRTETVALRVGRAGSTEAGERTSSPQAERPAAPLRDVDVAVAKVQEEARVAAPLPLSRRNLVRRYFSALRAQAARAQDAPPAAPVLPLPNAPRPQNLVPK